VLASAVVIAPQCLHNPLADLDPMLIELWLRMFRRRSRSSAPIHQDPYTIGFFYATGLFAIAVCIFRLVYADRVRIHLILLFLLAVSWAIAAVQIRGAMFSNLLAVFPLTLLIIDIRRVSNGDSENGAAALSATSSPFC
jgi:hypothetical protein